MTDRPALVILVGLAAALGACVPVEPGESGVEAEFRRLQGKNGFAVISNQPERTVFAARGKNVVIAPASGFCVAPDSLDVSGRAAFALVADCGGEVAGGPRAFPGIMTVSVSGTPMVPPGRDEVAALDELRRFIATPEGAALLGRGTPARGVSVIEMREIGSGLYVLVEDRAGQPLPVLGPRFWRAFVELSGRLTMVTVSAFRDRPVPEDTMLSFLTAQVVALRRANAAPASVEELEMAALAEDAFIGRRGGAGAPSRYQDVEIAVIDGDGADEPNAEAVGQAVADLGDGGTVARVGVPTNAPYRGPGAPPPASKATGGPVAQPAAAVYAGPGARAADPPYVGR